MASPACQHGLLSVISMFLQKRVKRQIVVFKHVLQSSEQHHVR